MPADAAVARGIDASPTPVPASAATRLRSRFAPVLGTVLLLMGVSAIAAAALAPDDAALAPDDAALGPDDAALASDDAALAPDDAAPVSVEVLGVVETAVPVPVEAVPQAPDPAAPPTVEPVVVADLPPAEELVGAAALALLPLDPAVRLPDWELTFLPGRDGVRALTFPRDRRIEVYVRETDTPEALVRVLAHELGHAVDVADNDAADRARWRAARGAGPEVPWWPDGTTYDFDTLAGDFAEAYATWLVGSESVSRVGGPFTPEQLALVAELVG